MQCYVHSVTHGRLRKSQHYVRYIRQRQGCRLEMTLFKLKWALSVIQRHLITKTSYDMTMTNDIL